jgi:hypothetical protein
MQRKPHERNARFNSSRNAPIGLVQSGVGVSSTINLVTRRLGALESNGGTLLSPDLLKAALDQVQRHIG